MTFDGSLVRHSTAHSRAALCAIRLQRFFAVVSDSFLPNIHDCDSLRHQCDSSALPALDSRYASCVCVCVCVKVMCVLISDARQDSIDQIGDDARFVFEILYADDTLIVDEHGDLAGI